MRAMRKFRGFRNGVGTAGRAAEKTVFASPSASFRKLAAMLAFVVAASGAGAGATAATSAEQAAGAEQAASAPQAMSDVATDHWAATYINELSALGIVDGYPQADGSVAFMPDGEITRGELMKLVAAATGFVPAADGALAEGFDGTAFADWQNVEDWAKPYVAALVSAGIVKGDDTGAGVYVYADRQVTRQEMIAMTMRALGNDPAYGDCAAPDFNQTADWAAGAVAFAVNCDLINTGADGSIRPNDNAKRDETAMMLYMQLKFPKPGETFADIEWMERSLLDDRLFVEMPVGSQTYRTPESLVAAYTSEQEETVLVFDDGSNGITLYAMEYFVSSTGDFDQDLLLAIGIEDGNSQGMSINRKTLGAGGAGAADIAEITPETFEQDSSGSVLLKGLFIRMPDDMLAMITVYASADSYLSDRAACADAADRIVQSLRVGPRAVNQSSPRTERIMGYEIALDAGYALSYAPGADFSVYYAQKIVDAEAATAGTGRAAFGIYIGSSPDVASESGMSVGATPGKVLGSDVEWTEYDGGDGILRVETLFPLPQGDGGAAPAAAVSGAVSGASGAGSATVYMHIFISAYEQKDLDAQLAMIETLKPV